MRVGARRGSAPPAEGKITGVDIIGNQTRIDGFEFAVLEQSSRRLAENQLEFAFGGKALPKSAGKNERGKAVDAKAHQATHFIRSA